MQMSQEAKYSTISDYKYLYLMDTNLQDLLATIMSIYPVKFRLV